MKQLQAIALYVILVVPLPSIAQVLTSPLSFDCDVPPGRVSIWQGAITAQGLLIEGKIQFIEPRKDTRWIPMASLFLRDETGKSLTGLQLKLQSASEKNMQIALVTPDPEKRTVFATGPWSNNQIQFQLDVLKSGNVKLTVGAASASTNIGSSTVATLLLSCSSAEVRFSDITLIPLDSAT